MEQKRGNISELAGEMASECLLITCLTELDKLLEKFSLRYGDASPSAMVAFLEACQIVLGEQKETENRERAKCVVKKGLLLLRIQSHRSFPTCMWDCR